MRNMDLDTSLNRMKELIDCGKKELDNVKFAQALEVILIALFNSKYNK